MKKLITLILVAVLMIGFAVVANAAVGTVVYGYKTDKAPNMEEIDESWGEPVAYITKDSPNAELAKYWTEYNDTAEWEHAGTGPNGRTTIVPEDSDFWLYILYDNKYIYFGFKSPDYEICGSETKHRGDGIHLWLQPLADMADPYNNSCGRAITDEYNSDGLEELYYYFWNLAFDDYSVDKGNASVNLDENPCINFYDDMMHATIAIPLSNYGLRNKNLHGYEFGTCVLRCSSKSTFDEGYAGWLNWGQWMSSYTTKTKGVNTVVLVDPAQGDVNVEIDTAPPVTEPVVTEPQVTEPPATEAPATEAPATEAPATEAPATEAPATEAPATEAPATEAPATEAPATEAPATEAPATEAPATEAPATEAPTTEAPTTEAPATEAPATEAPATEAPATEAPATEAPATEAPATEAPATEAPKAEEPAEKNNTGLIIGIVAAVVVVGAALGIILGKKKK